MKMRFVFTAAVAAVVSAFFSCSAPKTLYSWYGYENATYRYEKRATPELLNAMLAEYARIEKEQTSGRKTVPPGFSAEYGYLLYQNGQKEEGLKLLKREMELYPESKNYISRIVKQLEK